jgi:hypothetical protein
MDDLNNNLSIEDLENGRRFIQQINEIIDQYLENSGMFEFDIDENGPFSSSFLRLGVSFDSSLYQDIHEFIFNNQGDNTNSFENRNSVDINEFAIDEVTEKSENECSICINTYEVGDVFITTKCKHMFHYECLQQWVSDHSECPNCRCDLSNVNN